MSSLQGCIVGFGDPVLDIIAPSITNKFLNQHKMQSGGCIAIDEAQLDELLTRLYNNNPPLHLQKVPGGSAANVCKGIAGILSPSSPYHTNIYFVGCIGDDQDGEEYIHGLLQHNITPLFIKSTSGAPTAVCLCLITPGGQRTMRTRLGAALEYQNASQLPARLLLLGKDDEYDDGEEKKKKKEKEDSDDDMTTTTKTTNNHDNNNIPSNSEKVALFHAEGYCLYKPEATIAAMEAVSKSGGAVCIDLASFEVVHNCWTILNDILERKIVTLVFCNEQEAEAVCEKAGIITGNNNCNEEEEEDHHQLSAIQHAQDYLLNKGCQVAIVSRGAKGCVAKMKDGTVASAAARVDVVVVDTVGAGDLFTAGFLCVWMQGGALEECCKGGCAAGGEAVQVSGADVGVERLERLRVVMGDLVGKKQIKKEQNSARPRERLDC